MDLRNASILQVIPGRNLFFKNLSHPSPRDQTLLLEGVDLKIAWKAGDFSYSRSGYGEGRLFQKPSFSAFLPTMASHLEH